MKEAKNRAAPIQYLQRRFLCHGVCQGVPWLDSLVPDVQCGVIRCCHQEREENVSLSKLLATNAGSLGGCQMACEPHGSISECRYMEETKIDGHVIVANDHGHVHGKGRGLVHGRVHVQVHLYLSGGKAQLSNWR